MTATGIEQRVRQLSNVDLEELRKGSELRRIVLTSLLHEAQVTEFAAENELARRRAETASAPVSDQA